LVISGINPGPNLGIDTRYSGTVAAAFEGVQQNVPSFAVSLGSNKGPFHFEKAATFAKDVICMILRSDFEFAGTLINLNIPNSEKIRGLKVTRLNNNIYRDVFEKREDPRGRPYYWMVGGLDNHDQDPACDLEAIKAGFASVTPLRLDQTRHHKLEALAKTVSSEYKIKGHL
jgi:5'-nucleotidase